VSCRGVRDGTARDTAHDTARAQLTRTDANDEHGGAVARTRASAPTALKPLEEDSRYVPSDDDDTHSCAHDGTR
jgi:hypothetical protein